MFFKFLQRYEKKTTRQQDNKTTRFFELGIRGTEGIEGQRDRGTEGIEGQRE